jgi:hypothetical protein
VDEEVIDLIYIYILANNYADTIYCCPLAGAAPAATRNLI